MLAETLAALERSGRRLRYEYRDRVWTLTLFGPCGQVESLQARAAELEAAARQLAGKWAWLHALELEVEKAAAMGRAWRELVVPAVDGTTTEGETNA